MSVGTFSGDAGSSDQVGLVAGVTTGVLGDRVVFKTNLEGVIRVQARFCGS